MWLNKTKKIFFTVMFSMMVLGFAAAASNTTSKASKTATTTTQKPDLTKRFLDKANEAYEEGNVEDAYKYVNQALAVAKDETSLASVLYFAQTVYTVKLQGIQKDFDEMALIDVQMNLEKYPSIENSKIKKLLKQIDTDQENQKIAEQKADVEAQRRVERERFEAQQNSMDAQAQALKEQAAAIKEQSESTKQSQAELRAVMESGLKDMGTAFAESANETKRSTKVIAFSIIGIAFLILLIVLLIIVIVKKGFRQQQIQQEQYVQAFRVLAANQNQTNRIMLGGVTDLYGSNPTMRLAGTSTWAPAQALPDVEFTQEDEEELKQLAVKCEEIGSKIDVATNRKNNSKNVSELVYKMSMNLGLPQGMAMVNFCAAMVFDAGFLAVDPEILTAEKLTDEQKEIMKDHVNQSEKYLDFVPKKYWSIFNDAAVKHHENMDGTGYPKGLKGDDIPQIARLIRVAETYVSLSSKRNYRQTLDKETAIQMLKDQPQFYDLDVVNVLEQIV